MRLGVLPLIVVSAVASSSLVAGTPQNEFHGSQEYLCAAFLIEGSPCVVAHAGRVINEGFINKYGRADGHYFVEAAGWYRNVIGTQKEIVVNAEAPSGDSSYTPRAICDRTVVIDNASCSGTSKPISVPYTPGLCRTGYVRTFVTEGLLLHMVAESEFTVCAPTTN